MASGALPPGFPPVEIDGEYYWDGGLISNTPLQWVVESSPRAGHARFPGRCLERAWRGASKPRRSRDPSKDIRYSSRTRANTDQFKRAQRLRSALGGLLSKLPPDLHETREARLLSREADDKVYTLVHLIYRARTHEGTPRTTSSRA